MNRFDPQLKIIPLIVIGLLLVACSQTSQATETLAVDPTATTIPLTPEVEVQEVIQKIVIPSEVVVQNFIIQKMDEALEEIEIVVQGYISNTCTAIEDISLSREGDTFQVNIQTISTGSEACEEAEVQFQEVVKQDVSGLEPGTYFIAEGPVEKYIVQASSAEVAEVDAESTADSTPSGDAAVAAEDRQCEDYATFLADITYPDNTVVTTGETFTKTWEIRNDGDCAWGPGYTIEGVSGSFLEVIPVEESFPNVQPSQTIQLSLVLTAPQETGEVSGSWVIERPEGDNVKIQNGENFDLWAILNVVQGRAAFAGLENRVLKDGMVCAQTNDNYVSEVFDLINNVRAENELSPYQLSEPLTRAAWVLSADMACNGFYDYIGSDGSTLDDRITDGEYAYTDAGESIYYGFAGIPERAFAWWMENSRDSVNILSSTYTEIGIAYALNPQTGASYYTLVFAVPVTEG